MDNQVLGVAAALLTLALFIALTLSLPSASLFQALVVHCVVPPHRPILPGDFLISLHIILGHGLQTLTERCVTTPFYQSFLNHVFSFLKSSLPA